MFDQEKPKGLPSRGMLYLVAGIVIGVVGMAFVMIIANRARPRDAEPTSLPVIPTPAMGVTGTADAQTVPMAISSQRLLAFAVDEKNDLMVISFENDSIDSLLQTRPWPTENTQAAWLTLERGPTDYSSLFFDPQYHTVIAFSGALLHYFDPNSGQKSEDNRRLISWSPDGKWLAEQEDITSDLKIIRREGGSPVSTRALATTSVPMAITFSPNSEVIALVSMSESHRHTIEVFRLSDLTLVKSYLFEAAQVSPVVFSPDNIHMAVGVESSVRVLSLEDDEQRYFDTIRSIQQLAIDPTGKWLAVVGGETDPGSNKLITFYDLGESAPLAPSLTIAQTITMNNDVIGLQFVDEGLLVGEAWGNITLYRWTGEFWGEPLVVMENFK